MDDEIELRDAAAKQLVEHLRENRAREMTVPVVIEDETYEVIVRHKPVT